MSKVAVPLDGRVRTTGLPPSEQVFVAVEKIPIAAMSKSTAAPGTETPAVVGSTTTMLWPTEFGTAPVTAITASLSFNGATTNCTTFEREPAGFCSCTLTLPGRATSEGETAAV